MQRLKDMLDALADFSCWSVRSLLLMHRSFDQHFDTAYDMSLDIYQMPIRHMRKTADMQQLLHQLHELCKKETLQYW